MAGKTKKKKMSFFVKGNGNIDYQLVFLIFAVVGFGILMVYSASSYRAIKSGFSGYYFALRQAIFAVLGLCVMYGVSKVNYRIFQKCSKLSLTIAIVLQFLVFIIGVASHGAARWIPLGPIQFQPSEVSKLCIIIYLADMCCEAPELLNSVAGIIKAVIWPVICIGLIAVENLSTAIICCCIVIAIVIVASNQWQKIIGLVVALGAGMGLLLATKAYRMKRVMVWLHPEKYEEGFQTIQSLYAIGSGGLFGRGLGQSIQKMGFLPESHNDMIFSIICEELGLFGGMAVLLIFVMMIYRFYIIVQNSPDKFAGLTVVGIMTHIAVQMLVNVGVVTNTIPNTGVTLPFISYGGTSLVFLLVEIGVVLSITRQMKYEG